MSELAKLDLVGVKSDGTVVSISLAIGAPRPVDGHWRCPVVLGGIDSFPSHIAGEDAFQALCLAMRFMQQRLTDFIEKGGRLFFSGGGPDIADSEFPIEAYFGAAVGHN